MGLLFGTFKNPKGPSWKKPELIVFDLSGTLVELQLPKSNYRPPPEAMGGKFEFGKSQYFLDIDNTVSGKRSENLNTDSNGKLVFEHQLRRAFNLKGFPLLGQSAGCLHLLISICYNSEVSFKNCFYEEFLRELDELHGKEATEGYLNRLYPIDWSLINIHNAKFLSYGVEDFIVQSRRKSAFRIEFVCPISKDVAMSFKFKFGSIPIDSGGVKLANNLIQEVMQTFKISYKSEHKKQVEDLDLEGKFEPVKPVIWENFKKVPRVDYSVLEKYL
ncbi:hypothetical protein [Marinibactrum halimedae]|uniref:Uncharacterized protein n=1 Tax=Marinibactrum halimedae TaxID=1444977 RepID=A0AA37WNE0_9GAMM|nr:hypothetical protein [Marinibactrum halimedae]MCD9460388.1 hypothetical protein [Marinibactrum halimedae]GLS27483.1 hypothetical protein GCM10007877_32020 [Marinibactrum halimedae]